MKYISAIKSYYHSDENAYMPDGKGQKYLTRQANDKSLNGVKTYHWKIED